MNTRSSIGAIIGALDCMFHGLSVTKQRAGYFSLFFLPIFLYLDRMALLKRSTKYLVSCHLDYNMEVSIPQYIARTYSFLSLNSIYDLEIIRYHEKVFYLTSTCRLTIIRMNYAFAKHCRVALDYHITNIYWHFREIKLRPRYDHAFSWFQHVAYNLILQKYQ